MLGLLLYKYGGKIKYIYDVISVKNIRLGKESVRIGYGHV